MAWSKKRRHSIFIPNQITQGTDNFQSVPKSNSIADIAVVNFARSRKKNRKAKRQKRHISKQKNYIITPQNVSRETISTSKNEGFESVDKTPFDTELQKEQERVLKEQQERFNQTQEQRENKSEKQRRDTFQEKYGIFGKEYDTLMSTLGNSLFRMLKITQHLDSSQIMDIVHDYNGHANAEDIEHALLTLIANINDEYNNTVKVIRQTMQLGFTFEEAERIVSNELNNNYAPVKGVSALRDIIEDEVGIKDRERLREEIWNEYS